MININIDAEPEKSSLAILIVQARLCKDTEWESQCRGTQWQ